MNKHLLFIIIFGAALLMFAGYVMLGIACGYFADPEPPAPREEMRTMTYLALPLMTRTRDPHVFYQAVNGAVLKVTRYRWHATAVWYHDGAAHPVMCETIVLHTMTGKEE